MANIQQITRDYVLRARTEGVAEVTSAAQQLGAATDTLATKTETQSKSSISAAAALERQQRQLDLNYRAAKQFESAQSTLDKAQQQGLVTSTRHAELSALNAARFSQLSNASNVVEKDIGKVGQIMGVVESRAVGLNASMGMVGTVLQIIGPIGIAVGAGLGAAAAAMAIMSSAAHALAEKAKEIREFSEATGLTTTQFQALRSEAGKFGIDSETLSAGLSKFTAGFEELRNGQGTLLIDIRKVKPALTDQMQQTTDAATAFTLFGKAVQQTDNIFQRNALLKAGLGKGSAIFGSFFESAPDVAKLSDAFAAAGKGLDENLIKKLAILNADIARTKSAADTVFASVFAERVLTGEKQFADVLLDMAKTFKLISEFSFPTWLNDSATAAGKVALALTPIGKLVTVISGVKDLASAGAKAYDNKPVSMASFQSPANSYSTFQSVGAVATGQKTPEALAADWKNYIAVIGSAATPQERLNAAIAELGVKAKEAGLGGDILAKGIAALKFDNAIARQGAYVAALGGMAPVAEIVREKELQLQKQRQQDPRITQDVIDFQKKLTQAQTDGTFQIQSQISAETVRGKVLFMSEEAGLAYAISQTEINKQLAAGRPLQDINVAGIRAGAAETAKLTIANNRLEDAIKTAKDAGLDFSKSLVQGLMQGKSGIDALHDGLTALASKMADKALTDLFSGNFLQAGVEAVVAIGSALFASATDTKQAKALQEAQQQWAKMSDQVISFNAAAKGFDLGPLTNQLQSLYSTSKQLQDAAAKAHDFAGESSAANAFNSAVERIWKEFKDGTQTLDPLQQQIKSVNDEASGLRDTLNELGFSGRAAQIDGIVQAQIDALTKTFNASFITGLTARLNTATGQQFLTDAANLLVQHQQDLTQAGELGNDPTLLAQVASTFHAEAQKIVDDAGLVGSAFTDFTKQFPDLAGIVVQANQDMSASAKQLQDQMNQSAKTIVDFVNSENVGSNSPLSPTSQLAAAQLSYNTKLGLAQGGNADALGSITTDAQNLLTAARAVFASSTGYQSIFQNVTSQLLSLPAVQNTTDPTVAAMRDVLTAVNIGNQVLNLINATTGGTTGAVIAANSNIAGAVSGTTGAVNNVAGIQSGTLLPAINAGSASSVASALAAYFNQIDPTGQLAAVVASSQNTSAYTQGYLPAMYANSSSTSYNTANAATNGGLTKASVDTNNSLTGNSNTILGAIQGLQATANTQLTLLQLALSPTAVNIQVTPSGNTPLPGTSDPHVGTNYLLQNQVVTALNKMVWNTKIIADNTAYNPNIPVGSGTLQHGHSGIGVYATGGVIPPYGLGLVSEHFNPTFLRAGPEPITVSPYAPAPSFRGGNDNSEIRALRLQVEKLTGIVDQLRKENNSGNAAIANTVSGGLKDHAEKLGGKIEESGKRAAFAATQTAKEKKAAA